MAEVRLGRAAEKDFKQMSPGPERTRIVAGLRRLAQDAPNLDIKPIAATPGWFRLRIGDYRVCYYRAQLDSPSGPVTSYAVERIVPRGAFDAVAASLPE